MYYLNVLLKCICHSGNSFKTLSAKAQIIIIGIIQRHKGIANITIKPIAIYKIILLRAFRSSLFIYDLFLPLTMA